MCWDNVRKLNRMPDAHQEWEKSMALNRIASAESSNSTTPPTNDEKMLTDRVGDANHEVSFLWFPGHTFCSPLPQIYIPIPRQL